MTDDEYLAAWIDGYLAGNERGREELTGEQNAAWPPAKTYAFGRWYDQATERQKWYANARNPRPTDFLGTQEAAA